MDAFTARSEREVRSAGSGLAGIQEQCLEHIRYLSEVESFYRSVADEVHFDMEEERHNAAISFIASVGASLAGVTHQLGFTGGLYDPDRITGPSAPGREAPNIKIGECRNGEPLATVDFPGTGMELREGDLRVWAAKLLGAADDMVQG